MSCNHVFGLYNEEISTQGRPPLDSIGDMCRECCKCWSNWRWQPFSWFWINLPTESADKVPLFIFSFPFFIAPHVYVLLGTGFSIAKLHLYILPTLSQVRNGNQSCIGASSNALKLFKLWCASTDDPLDGRHFVFACWPNRLADGKGQTRGAGILK